MTELIRLLHEQHDSSHEHIINALLSMVQDHQGLLDECKKADHGLAGLLTTRHGLLHGKEQYQVQYVFGVNYKEEKSI